MSTLFFFCKFGEEEEEEEEEEHKWILIAGRTGGGFASPANHLFIDGKQEGGKARKKTSFERSSLDVFLQELPTCLQPHAERNCSSSECWYQR